MSQFHVGVVIYPNASPHRPTTCTCARFRKPYSSDPLIDLSAGTSADEVSIARIMQRYAARNCKDP